MDSVFVKAEFFLLVFFSLILPISLYTFLMWKRVISRGAVLAFGLAMIGIAGINICLLPALSKLAAVSKSLVDDKVFSSELSLAWYLLPVVFAGIGTNLLSHALIGHLDEAQRRFKEHR